MVTSSYYKELRNDDAHLWLILTNLSPSPNYTKYSVYNNNVASCSLHNELTGSLLYMGMRVS